MSASGIESPRALRPRKQVNYAESPTFTKRQNQDSDFDIQKALMEDEKFEAELESKLKLQETRKRQRKIKRELKLAEEGGYTPIGRRSEVYRDLIKYGYKTVGTLGRGAHASVYLIEINGKKYASKMFPIEENWRDIDLGSALPDIAYSLLLKHPYVIESHDLVVTDSYMYLLMDVGDTSLSKRLRKEKLDFATKKKYIYQIGSALNYVSSLGLVHCDIKADNIILRNDNALVADFGLIRIKDNIIEKYCQTMGFKAPEIFYSQFDRNYYNSKYPRKINKWSEDQIRSEYWSFGVVCLEIIYGKPHIFTTTDFSNAPAFKGKPNDHWSVNDFIIEMLTKYEDDVYNQVSRMFGWLPQEERELLYTVCQMFLRVNPENRVKSYGEFLNSKVFNDVSVPQLDRFSGVRKSLPMVTVENVLSSPHLNIVNKWIFEVIEAVELPSFVAFDAVDMLMQLGSKYITKRQEIQMVACAFMWLAGNIHNASSIIYDKVRMETTMYLHKAMKARRSEQNDSESSDKAPKPEDINDLSVTYLTAMASNTFSVIDLKNKILEIIKGENGYLVLDGVYNYMNNLTQLYIAYLYMINTKKYIELGSPHSLALHIYKMEEDGVFESLGSGGDMDSFTVDDYYFVKELAVAINDPELRAM